MLSSPDRRERGAILIHVAVASLVLIAFTMFVVDYGILWVSRNQAQNSADAGALAGATALGFDNFVNHDDDGPAKLSAHRMALANAVFGLSPDVQIATDIRFYNDAPSEFPDECVDNTCIRVDVFRNQTRGNALPMWFGQLVGLNQQGVRATAIARAEFGDSTDCLKPWAVVDRWEEHWPLPVVPYNDDSTFDKYHKVGNDWEVDPSVLDPDVYRAPSPGDPGTGFHPYTTDGNGNRTYTSDYGLQMALKVGSLHGNFEFGAGWYMALALNDSTGGSDYRKNIKECVGTTYSIGDDLDILNEPGVMTGPTRGGVETDGEPEFEPDDDEETGIQMDSLVNQDPDARWDDTIDPNTGRMVGVVDSAFAVSPRIVAIPLVNPDVLFDNLRNGRNTVPISNIAGFFIEGYDNASGSVIGRLMTMPGLRSSGSNPPNPESSFLVNVTLIR